MAIPKWICGSCETEFIPDVGEVHFSFSCPNCGSALTKPVRRPVEWEQDSDITSAGDN